MRKLARRFVVSRTPDVLPLPRPMRAVANIFLTLSSPQFYFELLSYSYCEMAPVCST